MDRFAKMLDEIRGEVERVNVREAERRAWRWLATLDDHSAEGMWFEALAETFPSRLEAALAYLRDVKRPPPTR